MKKTVNFLLALALLTGCADEKTSSVLETVPETTSPVIVTTATTTAEDALITGKYNNAAVSAEEAALGVTAERKASFIMEFGYEVYDVAMQSLPMFLNYSQNNTPSLSETDYSDISESYELERVTISSSYDGHEIPADYIQSGKQGKDTVLLVHGLGEHRRKPKEYIQMFLELGYNVLAYDQRSAGENTAPYTTYGILEHHDTVDCVKYLSGKIGDNKVILFGKSMGGMTAAMALGDAEIAESISYAILDFPVGSFKGMIEKNIKGYCPDEYIDEALSCDDEFLRYFLDIDFSMGEVSEYVKDTKTPVLIFSSTADDIVPPEQQQGIFDAIKGNRKYIYVDDTATHCGLFYTQRDMYQKLVEQFLAGKLI